MKRNVYLNMVTLEQAGAAFFEAFDWLRLVGQEELPAAEALGRVTAGPVFARYSVPAYNGAAMDGFAVRAADTFGASEERPLRLDLGRQAHPVNTGEPLPPGADAVVMIEQVAQAPGDQLELHAAAFPWQHVRRVGEDVVAREMVLPGHRLLGATDVAALLSVGVLSLPVLCRPQVAILPTGNERVDPRSVGPEGPPPGAIIESNSALLAGLVQEAGGVPRVLPPLPDDPQAITRGVQQALAAGAHLVVLNAGASAGSRDYTAHVVQGLGRVLVHGVMAMPGKPTLLGEVRGRPVVGAPGYPVSAWVCFDQFIGPALARMRGQPPRRRPELQVIPARRLPSKLGQEEFLRVHLGRVGDQVVATPLKRGAGAITSLTRADGLLRIGPASDGLEEGAPATAEVLGDPRAVDRTLVVVGSHDITLDHLADLLRRGPQGVELSAANVGSLAGLIAVRDGRCHLAGTHLLDEESGEYNVSSVRRYLPGTPARLVTLALREQGILVRRGNPRGITGLQSLARPGVRFVNRQRGSGTRVLLDYHLRRLGLDPAHIEGYPQEEFTHMAVAVQVLTGGADAGLGILAAAQALDLDFIPVATERYDLLIPCRFWEDPRIQAVLAALRSEAFREAVRALGGYDVSPMGEIAWEGGG